MKFKLCSDRNPESVHFGCVTDQQRKINELNANNLNLSEHVIKSSTRISELEEKAKSSERQLAEKREQAELIEEKLKLLDGENFRLKRANEYVLGTLEDLERKVGSLEDEKQELSERICSIKATLNSEMHEHQMTKDKLRQTITPINELNKKLMQQKEEISHGLVQRKKLEYQIAHLKENLMEMERNYWSLKELVLQAEDEKEDRLKLEKTIENLNAKVKSLKTQIKEIESASAYNMSKFCETLDSSLANVEQGLTEMQTNCKKSSDKLTKIVEIVITKSD